MPHAAANAGFFRRHARQLVYPAWIGLVGDSVDVLVTLEQQDEHHFRCRFRMANRRLLLIDDNVRLVGGHFFELMSLVAEAGRRGGYEVHAAVHQSFDDHDQVHPGVTVHPVFETRRLVRWSLGVDGISRLPRDLDGNSIGKPLRRLRSDLHDFFRLPSKRPRHALRIWQSNLGSWLTSMSANHADRVVFNTADDFCLLALAGVLMDFRRDPLLISAIVHFALVDRQTKRPTRMLDRIGQQLRGAYQEIENRGAAAHRISLFATTQSLTEQYRATRCGFPVQAVDYPTRRIDLPHRPAGAPIRCVLAGLPRAEKGRDLIAGYLKSIEYLLRSGEFLIAAQMPADQWQSIIPRSMHSHVELDGVSIGPPEVETFIEIRTGGLGMQQYHQWLDQADLGIFLYDPDRYEARASGVLLELMVRGAAVIVPDRCHMAQEVMRYGGDGVCGWIYQHHDEVASLMLKFARDRVRVSAACQNIAARVANNHDATTLLARMNLLERRRMAA